MACNGRAYWTCKCGGWTWAATPIARCFKCGAPQSNAARKWLASDGTSKSVGHDHRKLHKPPEARNDVGQCPTRSVDLEEWIVQPTNLRKQAKARKAAERIAARSTSERSTRDTKAPAPAVTTVVDEAMDAQDEHSEMGKLEKLLVHLQDFPSDEGVEELRSRYQQRLCQLRSEGSERQRDPTLQLLRAQRITRKRERQRDATARKMAALETKLDEVRAELEQARSEMAQAEKIIAEARLQEDSMRQHIASPQPGLQEPHSHPDIAETVAGLKAQLDALPSAFNSGNMEAAHAAMCAQFDRIAASLREPASKERHDGPVSASRATVDAHVDCKDAEGPPAASSVRGRPDCRVLAAGRRVTSPARGSRSRSRSDDSAGSSDQEGKLRRAANQPGQKSIRSWAVEASRG